VRYEAVTAMLFNEFLKEHRKVEEQEATIAQLKKGVQVLTAQLHEQASQIQKVSAQLELSKPAPNSRIRNQPSRSAVWRLPILLSRSVACAKR
jgi:hypothetical protein